MINILTENGLQYLKDIIHSRGLKLKYVAKQLGITPYGLAKKLKGLNEFTVREMNLLISVLSLDKEDYTRIFLPSVFNNIEQTTNKTKRRTND